MKKILLICSSLLLTSKVFAAPACTTFTLGAAPAECRNDDLIFSSFIYSPSFGAPSASLIAVNPVSGTLGLGLEFSGPFFLIGANRFMIFSIEFDVTASPSSGPIDGAGLSANNIFAVGGVAGVNLWRPSLPPHRRFM